MAGLVFSKFLLYSVKTALNILSFSAFECRSCAFWGAKKVSLGTRNCWLLDIPAWPVRQKNLYPGLAKFQSQGYH